MKHKLLFILLTLLFTSCAQLQVPIASTVTNVTVFKTQITDDKGIMTGSSLEKFRQDNEAGDAEFNQNKKEDNK